jgi:hydrogenase nickel incorporation protein HypA/HybF
VHELSIANALVSVATEAADRAHEPGPIRAVTVRIGDLSGVVPQALTFAWPLAAEGTRCEGAELRINRVAARVHCPACDIETEIPSPPRFRCERCGQPAPLVSAGRELELESLELADDDPPRDTEGRAHAASHP